MYLLSTPQHATKAVVVRGRDAAGVAKHKHDALALRLDKDGTSPPAALPNPTILYQLPMALVITMLHFISCALFPPIAVIAGIACSFPALVRCGEANLGVVPQAPQAVLEVTSHVMQ
jgi:hypothetical protein